MLTIICGEDEVAARNYFSSLKSQYRNHGDEVADLQVKSASDLNPVNLASQSLFASKSIYFVQNLNRLISGQKDKLKLKEIKDYLADPSVVIIDWEGGKGSRELKIAGFGTVKEFKLSNSIFSLLDGLYPGNRIQFLTALNTVLENQEEGFIYAMLCRQTRTLLLAATNSLPASVGWQRTKLTSQAKQWKLDRLVSFYEGLTRIDLTLKTSSNVYGIRKSLDILACYFL